MSYLSDKSESFEVERPLFAGVFARGVKPDEKPFYITNTYSLDEAVQPDALASAWDATMRVYPYFTKAVVKGDGAYCLAKNPLDFVICQTD